MAAATAGEIGALTCPFSRVIPIAQRCHHTLKGPWTFTLDNAGVGAAINHATGLFTDTTQSAKLTTPGVLEFGTRKQIAQNWTALLEVDWTGWSKFGGTASV